MTQGRIAPVIDRDGNRLTLIELSNRPGAFVWMDREYWRRWVMDGLPQALYAVHGNGRRGWTVAYWTIEAGRKTWTNAAQGIMRPPPGYRAMRRSADPLDLRRANLKVLRASRKLRPDQSLSI